MKFLHRRVAILATCLASYLPSPPLSAGGDPVGTAAASPYDEIVIWQDPSRDPHYPDPAAQPTAEFLPEKALNAMTFEELPLPPASVERLRILLDRGTRPPLNHFGQTVDPCGYSSGTPGKRGKGPSAHSLEQELAPIPLVFTAKVVAAVPGWSGEQVSTAYFFEPQLILKDVLACLKPGQIYSGTLIGGEIEVRGERACSYIHPGYYRPSVGDVAFLTGVCLPNYSENHLILGLRAKVVGDEMLAEPWAFIESPDRVNLIELAVKLLQAKGRNDEKTGEGVDDPDSSGDGGTGSAAGASLPGTSHDSHRR